jgi:hypothetical protein
VNHGLSTGATAGAAQAAPELNRANIERVCKILCRLGAERDTEALQSLRAATKALRDCGLDWVDVQAMLLEHGTPKAAVAKPIPRWGAMHLSDKWAHLRSIQARDDLTDQEKLMLIGINDMLCIAPGNAISADGEELIDRLIRKQHRAQTKQ